MLWEMHEKKGLYDGMISCCNAFCDNVSRINSYVTFSWCCLLSLCSMKMAVKNNKRCSYNNEYNWSCKCWHSFSLIGKPLVLSVSDLSLIVMIFIVFQDWDTTWPRVCQLRKFLRSTWPPLIPWLMNIKRRTKSLLNGLPRIKTSWLMTYIVWETIRISERWFDSNASQSYCCIKSRYIFSWISWTRELEWWGIMPMSWWNLNKSNERNFDRQNILCKDCYGFSIKMSLMDNECRALILSTKNLVFDLVSATTPSKGCGQTYQHDSWSVQGHSAGEEQVGVLESDK